MPKVSTEQMIAAVEKTHGLLSVAARTLGIKRDTISRRMMQSDELRKTVEDACRCIADLAGGRLLQATQDGEGEEFCSYLTRQCKHREHAISGAVDQNAEIQLEQPVTQDERLAEAFEILEQAKAREARAAAGAQDTAVHPPADADAGESPQP